MKNNSKQYVDEYFYFASIYGIEQVVLDQSRVTL
jgi:hypothetical protein